MSMKKNYTCILLVKDLDRNCCETYNNAFYAYMYAFFLGAKMVFLSF